DREFFERVLLGFRLASLDDRVIVIVIVSLALGHAVRNVLDEVQTSDAVFFERLDGKRVVLGEHRDHHVEAAKLRFSTRLDVNRRTLQHSTEAVRRSGRTATVLGLRNFLFEYTLQLCPDRDDVPTTSLYGF